MSQTTFTWSIIFIFLLTGSDSLQQQNLSTFDDRQVIEETIVSLFDGMREGDAERVRSVFTEDAVMQSVIINEQGDAGLRTGSLEGFVNAVGAEKDDIWDEKIGSLTIHIDLPMASVWVPYKFYRGDNFSHCGVNSFQMVKKKGAWKIFYIVDTRRTNNCID